ncbi:hypothetical protein Tco_0591803, partial [Tanacetum coccineum]
SLLKDVDASMKKRSKHQGTSSSSSAGQYKLPARASRVPQAVTLVVGDSTPSVQEVVANVGNDNLTNGVFKALHDDAADV